MVDPIRSDPKGLRTPSFGDALIVDTYRGQLRIRSWPRKRGPSKAPGVREQNLYMQWSAHAWKYVAPSQRVTLLEQARRGPILDRDAWMLAQQGKIYELHDSDGTVITRRRPFLERLMFNGMIAQKEATQVLTANVSAAIVWPLPVLDTYEFWNPSAPTKITIPEGVRIIRIEAGLRLSGAINGTMIVQVQRLSDGHIATGRETGTSIDNVQVTTGAFLVDEGDELEILALSTVTGTVPIDRRTFVSLQVLDTALVGDP